MYFASRTFTYDKKCAYYSYCNYLGYEYKDKFLDNNTVEEFYQFLWQKNHPFIFIEKATFMSLFMKNIPHTNMFLVENNHIYLIKKNQVPTNIDDKLKLQTIKQYTLMDSNLKETQTILREQIMERVMRSTFVLVELTPAINSYLKITMKPYIQKNEFYRKKYQHITKMIDLYNERIGETGGYIVKPPT